MATSISIKSVLETLKFPNDFIAKIPTPILSIANLTFAEKALFEHCREGSISGRLPYYATKSISSRDNIIRAELLEWMIIYHSDVFFPQKKLTISNATICRSIDISNIVEIREDFIKERDDKDFQPKFTTSKPSLNFAYKNISIDLTFIHCFFPQGLNFYNTTTQNFSLHSCDIGKFSDDFLRRLISVNLFQAKIKGNLSITNQPEPLEYIDSTYKYEPNSYPFVTSCIFLQNINVDDSCNFRMLELGANAPIEAYGLKSKKASFSEITSESYIEITYANIDGLLDCINCTIKGCNDEGYSFDAGRMYAKDVMLRDGTCLHHGCNFFNSSLTSLDMSGLCAFPNLNNQLEDITIDLRSVTIKEDVWFFPKRILRGHNRTIVFGKILLDNAEINSLSFAGLTVIYDKNKRAISADNLKAQHITFGNTKQSLPYKNYLESKKDEEIGSLLEKNIDSVPIIRFLGQELEGKKEIKKEDIEPFWVTSAKYIKVDVIELIDKVVFQSDEIKKIKKIKEKYSEVHLKKFQNWYKDYQEGMSKVEDILQKVQYEEHFFKSAAIIGEVSFNGLQCSRVDICSAFFYSDGSKQTSNNQKLQDVISIKFADIKGQLFLNDGPDDKYPFVPIGRLDLQSSKVGQLFITPKRGIDAHSDWKIIGLKYDYIYSNEKDKKGTDETELEKCEWFSKYREENNRQPFEQLASAYLNVGDDTKARNTLLKMPKRIEWSDVQDRTIKLLDKTIKFFGFIFEHLVARVLGFFANQGTPFYKAFGWLIFIVLFGWGVFWGAEKKGCITHANSYSTTKIKDEKEKTLFNPLVYSLESVIPFFSTEHKNGFIIVNNEKAFMYIEFPSDKSKCIKYIDQGSCFKFYRFFHTILGTIFLGMFLIGITRIVQRR